ncbi:hypothetical protein [Amnibacterium endophyticum]|uniref:Sugar ABC transporter ATPase n=1 Tax=Amnibacterium endophyticum TaxID=2109337 RepID=A0ABW4LFR6_9MICO
MSDPLAEEGDGALTGMTTNGAFSGDREEPSTGEGDDAPTSGIEIEGEPDPGPEEIEPGQG